MTKKQTKGNPVLRIAINLDGVNRDKFLQIQEDLGIKNKTDVLRWLISWGHKNIKKGESPE